MRQEPRIITLKRCAKGLRLAKETLDRTQYIEFLFRGFLTMPKEQRSYKRMIKRYILKEFDTDEEADRVLKEFVKVKIQDPLRAAQEAVQLAKDEQGSAK